MGYHRPKSSSYSSDQWENRTHQVQPVSFAKTQGSFLAQIQLQNVYHVILVADGTTNYQQIPKMYTLLGVKSRFHIAILSQCHRSTEKRGKNGTTI